MKRLIIILIVSITISKISAQQKKWTLQNCIDYAYEHNISLKKQTLQTKVIKENLRQSKLDRLPNLNASSDFKQSFGQSLSAQNTYVNQNLKRLSFGINSSVTLFSGFIKNKTIKKNKTNLLAQLENLEKAKEDLALNITSYYLQVLSNIDQLKIAKEQVQLTQEQVERTESLIAAGTVPKGDLLELQSQKAEEELSVVEVQNQLTLSYLELAQLLDLENVIDFSITEPNIDIDRSAQPLTLAASVYDRSLQIRPGIKALEHQIKSSELDLQIKKGSRYPVLALNGGWDSYYLDKVKDDFSKQLENHQTKFWGMSLSIPVFNQWKVVESINLSKLDIEDAKLNLENEKNNLRKEIQEAYTNATAALKKYYSSETAVVASKEAFRYAEEKYKSGMISLFDYSQAKNKLNVARLKLTQSKYEYIFRTKILDFYNGIPITL